MSASQIIQCPFCRSLEVRPVEVEVRVFAVCCDECGATGPIENYDSAQQTRERAIELWNRRES